LDNLSELVNDTQRPVQLIFSGKAHPATSPASISSEIENLRHVAALPADAFIGTTISTSPGPGARRRRVAQHSATTQGSSGTSGMKAVLNGGLNLSILDGWWAELQRQNGFAIGRWPAHVRTRSRDAMRTTSQRAPQ